MNEPTVDRQAGPALDALASGGEAVLGMAALGKMAAVLALVVGLILLCAYLLKRLGPAQAMGARRLRVVASQAVGPRERVVVLELAGEWLVVGVGGGQVSRLHVLPEPPQETGPGGRASNVPESFAARLGEVLRGGDPGRGRAP